MQRRTNAEGDGTALCASVSSVCAFKHELLAMCKKDEKKCDRKSLA